MFRVATLAKLICDSWTGEDSLNTEIVLHSCLLHDMGNIIKFDFDNFPELLGKEQKNTEYWKTIKREMIEKYGKDEDQATVQICKELGIKDDVLFFSRKLGI